MRILKRNTQKIYYANYVSEVPIYDTNSLMTGDFTKSYSSPQEAFVNVSASRGNADLELFGTDVDYTNTSISDKDLGIDENSILWVGVASTASYNYKVTNVAKSINSVAYAIRKVDVSED